MRIITSLIIHNVQRQKRLHSPYGLRESKNHAAIFYLNLTDPPQLNTDLHLAKQKVLQLRRHLMNRMGGEPRGSAVTTPHRADVGVFARHLDRERGRQRASDLHDKQRHPLSGGRTGSCKAGVRHSQQGRSSHQSYKHTYLWAVSAVPSQPWMVEEWQSLCTAEEWLVRYTFRATPRHSKITQFSSWRI